MFEQQALWWQKAPYVGMRPSSDSPARIHEELEEEEEEDEELSDVVERATMPTHFWHDRLRLLLVSLSIFMLFLGVVVGMCLEGWDFVTAAYVIVQLISTIGYGDVEIRTKDMRIFLIFYEFALLITAGNMLGAFFEAFHKRSVRWFRENWRSHSRPVLHPLSRGNPSELIDQIASLFPQDGRTKDALAHLFCATVHWLVAVFFGMLLFQYLFPCTCQGYDGQIPHCICNTERECWKSGGVQLDWWQALYMSTITSTAVGFGTYSPRNFGAEDKGMFTCMVWMIWSVCATLIFVGACANMVTVLAVSYDRTDGMDQKYIDFQPAQPDAELCSTRAEFMQCILVKGGWVTDEICCEINEQYDKMRRSQGRTPD